MNRRQFFKAAAGALCCAILAGCAKQYTTLRYRLKIAVRIAEQLYEGASVIETEIGYWGESPGWLMQGGSLTSKSWGEAVVIDLAEHGLLFGLLYPVGGGLRRGGFSVNRADDILFSFLPNDQRDTGKRLKRLPSLQGEFRLQEADRPILVRFRDISDPSTFEVVDPSQLTEIYGPDSSFESATISITQDSITRRIDELLPWLEIIEPTSLRPGRLSRPHFKVEGPD